MIIDIFKGEQLYQNLKHLNPLIASACQGFHFIDGRPYDTTQNEASWWFDPMKVRNLAISHVYPECLEVQKDPRLCLNLYAPNYLSLLLINTLYPDKDTVIEDQAAGMGRLIFYLHKLGYKQFNAIEDFTQLPRALFQSNMDKNNIYCHLNVMGLVPKIVNLVGYTVFPKKIFLDTELVIVYNNEDIIIKGESTDLMYRTTLENFQLLENKVFLCKDNYDLAKAYCNKEKYDEFKNKLREYEA